MTKIIEVTKVCPKCGKVSVTDTKHSKKYCSSECRYASMLKGKDHYNWKGGETNHAAGYRTIDGKLKHRLIMENYLGRELSVDEIVHHINSDKKDNRIENLKLMTKAEHTHLHHIGVPKPHKKGWHVLGKWKIFTCKTCGKEFGDHAYRNRVTCSRECSEYTLIKKGERIGKETEFKKR